MGIVLVALGAASPAMRAVAEELEAVPPSNVVTVSNTAELRQAIGAAGPGTKIRVKSGEYEGGMEFSGVAGLEGRPIIIEAETPETPPVIRGGDQALKFVSPRNLVLRHLTFDGARLAAVHIDDGGDPQAPGRELWLEDLVIRNLSPTERNDAIRLANVIEFRVERCRIERWGAEGQAITLIGCQRGSVAGCQLAGTSERAGIEVRGGSRDVTVRRCAFSGQLRRACQIGGATDLASFRPPLAEPQVETDTDEGVPDEPLATTADSEDPEHSTEASAASPQHSTSAGEHAAGQPLKSTATTRPTMANGESEPVEAAAIVVEDCTFNGGETAMALVGSDNVLVRRNVFYRPRARVGRILQEQPDSRFAPCRNGAFVDNIIVWRSRELTTFVDAGPGTRPETFHFAANCWYCEDQPGRSRPQGLPTAEIDGVYGIDPGLTNPAGGDLRPRRSLQEMREAAAGHPQRRRMWLAAGASVCMAFLGGGMLLARRNRKARARQSAEQQARRHRSHSSRRSHRSRRSRYSSPE